MSDPYENLIGTPFEVAQLAVSLALLKGESEPNLDSAIDLLYQAHFKVRRQTRPEPNCVGVATLAITDQRPVETALGAMRLQKVVSPADSSELAKVMKSFPGADQIEEPKKPRFSMLNIIEAVTKRRGRKENQEIIAKLKAANELNEQEFRHPYSGSVSFWTKAKNFAPYASRFRELYTTSASKIAHPKRRRARKGTFQAPKRGEDGRFKKS